jgi:7-cyano-7-deazaguanine synthase in queuosine biosynthesis
MTRRGVFRYHFASHGQTKLEGWEPLSNDDFHDLPRHMESLIAIADDDRVWAQDLLRIAKAAYLADRRSPRNMMLDGWTRTIKLSVQIIAPDKWSDQQEADLSDLLGMLTGDQWEISLRGGAATQHTLQDDAWATDVALFSGGLDSTAYAAQLAHRLKKDERALFVAYDWNLQKPQQQIFKSVQKITSHRIDLHQTRLNPKAHGKKLDGSNRARSLLFIVTAICVAAVHRVTSVAVPENGQLAINPALTPGRLSSCSTRSVHPWTLHLINRIIAGVGGDITVHNPFLNFTKGQVCKEACRAGLAVEIIQKETVSCGHPTTARPHYHCGYCFPCLVRRAGLHTVLDGQPDQSGYQVDIAEIDSLPYNDPKATDLRDLAYWLEQEFTVQDLIADAPLPPDIAPTTLIPALRAGRAELATMISNLTASNSSFRRHWNPK